MVQDKNPAGQGQDEMRKEEDEIGFIEIVIVLYGIVDDDGKEDDGTTEEGRDESVGSLVEPGFLVQRTV